MPVRILIGDDHGVLRAGLRSLLNAQEDFQVIGDAADGVEVLRRASELQPDVVLLDISMPGPNGIEITRQLKQLVPETQILVLTFHEDEGLFQEALRAGASGYIVKRAVESELTNAIRAVMQGNVYVDPVLTRALLKDLSPLAAVDTQQPELTRRELEVLRLIVQGYTNQQIASQLVLSVRTVESHRANLMSKLELRNRAELVHYAKEHGLLEPTVNGPEPQTSARDRK
jgi:two-component system, NarL family, response regulator NreC